MWIREYPAKSQNVCGHWTGITVISISTFPLSLMTAFPRCLFTGHSNYQFAGDLRENYFYCGLFSLELIELCDYLVTTLRHQMTPHTLNGDLIYECFETGSQGARSGSHLRYLQATCSVTSVIRRGIAIHSLCSLRIRFTIPSGDWVLFRRYELGGKVFPENRFHLHPSRYVR